jgi:hypothetical protein
MIDLTEGTLPVDEAEEAAYKASLTADLTEQTIFLLDHIGPRITAAALGLKDARPLKAWKTGDTGPKSAAVAERLRILFRMAYAIVGVYGVRTASAFLRSANPQLDNESPVVLLRVDDPAQVEAKLLWAMRAFLEG